MKIDVNKKTESELISEHAVELRKKNAYWEKRYSFVLKADYWDADELNRLLILDGRDWQFTLPVSGDEPVQKIVLISTSGVPSKEFVTLRADQLVDLIHMDISHVNAILDSIRVFGRVEVMSLEAPGLPEMRSYCKKMDSLISESLKDLRKNNVSHGARKLWRELGGDACPSTDRLAKRLKYIWMVLEHWQSDKPKWQETVKRIGIM